MCLPSLFGHVYVSPDGHAGNPFEQNIVPSPDDELPPPDDELLDELKIQ